MLTDIFFEVQDLKFYHAVEIEFKNEKIILSRTGYTGELGFEIYGSGDSINLIIEQDR